VHAGVPLQRHHRALDGLQQADRQDQYQRQPDRRVQQVGRRPRQLDIECQRHDHVPDHDDHEVGGEVVGAMMVKGLATRPASIGDFHEASEETALAAGRAAAAQTVQ